MLVEVSKLEIKRKKHEGFSQKIWIQVPALPHNASVTNHGQVLTYLSTYSSAKWTHRPVLKAKENDVCESSLETVKC